MVLKILGLALVATFASGVVLLASAAQVAAQAEVEHEKLNSPVECFPLNPPFTGWQACSWLEGVSHLTLAPNGNEILVANAGGCFEIKNPQGQVVENSCETDHLTFVTRQGNELHVARENIRQTNTFPGAICEVHWVLVRVNGRPTANVQRVSCTPT
jgi:hypothetical protein